MCVRIFVYSKSKISIIKTRNKNYTFEIPNFVSAIIKCLIWFIAIAGYFLVFGTTFAAFSRN